MEEQLKLSYPTNWSYTLIGTDLPDLKEAAEKVLEGREFDFRTSKASRNKKYLSAKLECVVSSENDRTRIYQELKSHPNVRMVL